MNMREEKNNNPQFQQSSRFSNNSINSIENGQNTVQILNINQNMLRSMSNEQININNIPISETPDELKDDFNEYRDNHKK